MQLHLVESFHETCFLHRELKPDNIVIGNGAEADRIFLIDLELAAKYRNPQTHEHTPFTMYVNFVGNPVFASNNKIQGTKSGRRDDLYSIGLMLIYFMRGCLPWSEVSRTPRRSAFDIVKEMKLTLPCALLVKGLPKPVGSLMEHALALGFDARPDYDGLRQQFQDWSAYFGKHTVCASQSMTLFSTCGLLCFLTLHASSVHTSCSSVQAASKELRCSGRSLCSHCRQRCAYGAVPASIP